MNIIVRGGVALSVLRDDLDCPFLSNPVGNLRPDMICEDLRTFHVDPNTRDIFLLREWGRYNVMTIEDIEEELQEFNDKKIRWRSEDHRKKLFDYYTKVHLIMKTYKREEQINKVLNSNEMQFYLAC